MGNRTKNSKFRSKNPKWYREYRKHESEELKKVVTMIQAISSFTVFIHRVAPEILLEFASGRPERIPGNCHSLLEFPEQEKSSIAGSLSDACTVLGSHGP